MKKREVLKIMSFALSIALILLGGWAVETGQFVIGFLGIVSGIAGVWLYFTKP